jgi:hypothetical protein
MNSFFLFQRSNYVWLLAGLGTIILGFILMSGGGSEDPKEFSDAIFSTRRIVIAPLVVLAGYGLVMYSIMKKAPAASNANTSK